MEAISYREAVEYLYSATPQFQQIGAAAYKPGLDTVIRIAGWLHNPQNSYKIIHVGGTNGKGSTAHTLAAVLQSAGYKVGLYTSPHLVDFRERVRVNGAKIPEEAVAGFVTRWKQSAISRELAPSFFELTTLMAFDWFRSSGVDIAVIEVGLGGRLDSTNIVNPILSVITNISLDHMAQLGNTCTQIAGEKAGIIKPGIPVVSGEENPEINAVFAERACRQGSPLRHAPSCYAGASFAIGSNELNVSTSRWGDLSFQLSGDCQRQNSRTILTAIDCLVEAGLRIPVEAVREGFANVCTLTGLAGRWMKLHDAPLAMCDTGHNIGGWTLLHKQIKALPRPLTIVLGFVNDKDTSHIFPLLPADARYIYTRAAIPRALPASELAARGADAGVPGECVEGVGEAYRKALAETPPEGSVFVGGSTFVVADLLAELEKSRD